MIRSSSNNKTNTISFPSLPLPTTARQQKKNAISIAHHYQTPFIATLRYRRAS